MIRTAPPRTPHRRISSESAWPIRGADGLPLHQTRTPRPLTPLPPIDGPRVAKLSRRISNVVVVIALLGALLFFASVLRGVMS